ncbi:MAG: hypothetical protein J6X43_11565 [Bacteroidales bacterium]|nr:hypothetical protein [Bacteroidales bacterium]
MKKIFVLSVLVSSMLFLGCKKEDDDVRNPYCGIYTGYLTHTSVRNGNEMSETNRTMIGVRKNGDNIKSVTVYYESNGGLLFTTQAMSVTNTPNGDGFCGYVYESVTKNEDDIDVTTTGLPISDDKDYSCEISPNKDGVLTLRFVSQKSYMMHGIEVMETFEFEGERN